MRSKALIIGVASLLMGVAAFQPAFAQTDVSFIIPDLGIVDGQIAHQETFDRIDAWENYSNPMGVELSVENGVYRAYTMNDGYAWGLNEQVHDDVILEVQATPMNPYFSSAFGVICRADTANNGAGYYFMINAEGYYSIRMGHGVDVLPLVEWTFSEAIHRELDQNMIRAVCVGDELAMYINGTFVAQVRDTTYDIGFAGLSVAGTASGEADVAFDNLTIYDIIPRNAI